MNSYNVYGDRYEELIEESIKAIEFGSQYKDNEERLIIK